MLVTLRRAAAVVILVAIGSCGESSTAPFDPLAPGVYLCFPNDSLFVGKSMRAIAVATGDSATVAWPMFSWTSSDTTIAVVDSMGIVLGINPGSARIIATFDGKSDSLTVRIVMQRVDGGGAFSSASVGFAKNCALSTTGIAYCFEIGAGDSVGKLTMLPGAGAVALTTLHTATTHTCGLTGDGVLMCWGSNASGQFLTGSTTPLSATTPVAGGGSLRFLAIALGTINSAGFTCGVTRPTGHVYCAGQNQFGQLGRSPTTMFDTTVKTVNTDPLVKSLAANGLSVCGINLSDIGICWGSTTSGGTSNAGTTPRSIAGVLQVSAIASSANHTCVVAIVAAAFGTTHCWGSNNAGQLGIGTATNTSQSIIPVQNAPTFQFLMASGAPNTSASFTCGLDLNHEAFCWGRFPPTSLSTRLGEQAYRPVHVARGVKFTSLSSDGVRLCGVTLDGRVFCM